MIKRITLYIITLIFTLTALLAGCSTNETITLQESAKESTKDIQSKLSNYMSDYSEKNDFSGTILVAKDNEVLLNRAYGMADYDNNIPNTAHTVFKIASITKQFTATAILMLQEKKLLSVQDSLSKYITNYPNGDKIKLFNLLTNTSGIPNTTVTNSLMTTYSPEELIELFKNKPLNFDPGTSYEYSNSNYILLGYIVEKASNMKYEDYIEKNILKPLNLTETGFLSRSDKIKNKAIGYNSTNFDLNTNAKASDIEDTFPYSAAEICSTAEDLYRWEIALLYTEKLIKKESLNEMLTPYLNNYGYGWVIYKNSIGDTLISHGGDLPGYGSLVGINIDKKYVFIILSNNNNSSGIGDIAIGLSEILENN